MLPDGSTLELHFTDKVAETFPLSSSKVSIENLFFLDTATSLSIVATQKIKMATGVAMILHLVAIRASLSRKGRPFALSVVMERWLQRLSSRLRQSDSLCGR